MSDAFETLLAPIGADVFFVDYFDRKPLHVAGTPEKAAALFTLADLDRLLDMAIWTPESLKLFLDTEPVPPAEYVRAAPDSSGRVVPRPDPERVAFWLGRGASLALNDIDQLHRALGTVAQGLERRTHGRTQANLYFSRRERQAFAVHFDTHDVYAVQCAGEKLWRIWTGREEAPINDAGGAYRTRPMEERHRRKGELLAEITMRPGDVLYLPRGQYHEALAVSDGVMHVTFGVIMPIGMDVLSWLFERAMATPLFRANLPTVEGTALAAHLARLGAAAGDLLRDPGFVAEAERRIRENGFPRATVGLPGVLAGEPVLSLTGTDFAVVRRGQQWILKGPAGAVALPEDVRPQTQWVLGQRSFTASALRRAFPSMAEPAAAKFVADLKAMAVIA